MLNKHSPEIIKQCLKQQNKENVTAVYISLLGLILFCGDLGQLWFG